MVTPEPDPLTNAYWKTERAKFHLDCLKDEIAAFCNDSHSIVTQDEPELDQVRYRIELKQPHVYIFLILGDVLQCLRTALDQAVWSLIHHRTGGDPGASEFPVFSHPLNENDRKKFKRKTDGLSDEAISYIESIQPYNRPTGMPLTSHLLWRLHELNRIDKHRRISVRTQISYAGRSAFGAGAPREDFAAISFEKTDYGFDAVCVGSYRHLRPNITSFVQFGEEKSGIAMIIDDVVRIYEFVTEEVMLSLARFRD